MSFCPLLTDDAFYHAVNKQNISKPQLLANFDLPDIMNRAAQSYSTIKTQCTRWKFPESLSNFAVCHFVKKWVSIFLKDLDFFQPSQMKLVMKCIPLFIGMQYTSALDLSVLSMKLKSPPGESPHLWTVMATALCYAAYQFVVVKLLRQVFMWFELSNSREVIYMHIMKARAFQSRQVQDMVTSGLLATGVQDQHFNRTTPIPLANGRLLLKPNYLSNSARLVVNFPSGKGMNDVVRASLLPFFRNLSRQLPELFKDAGLSCKFGVDALVQHRALHGLSTQFYVMKLDLRDCFNSLRHDKLLSVLETVFAKARRFMIPRPKVTELMRQLKQILGSTHVKLGQKYFQMTRGIPQGCPISVYLCALYLHQIVVRPNFNRLLQHQHGEILIRYVDDFLFVTKEHFRLMEFKTVFTQVLSENHLQLSEEKMDTIKSGGDDLQWLGLVLDSSLCFHLPPPPVQDLKLSRHGGCHSTVEAAIFRLRRGALKFRQFLSAFNPQVSTQNSRRESARHLGSWMALRFHAVCKTCLQRVMLERQMAPRLAGIVISRLVSITHQDELVQLAVKAFKERLHCYRGQYHSLFRMLDYRIRKGGIKI